MKSFYKIFVIGILLITACFLWVEISIARSKNDISDRSYRVDIARAETVIEEKGIDAVNIGNYKNITNIEKYDGNNEFFYAQRDNVIREINGELYRFDYISSADNNSVFLKKFHIVIVIIALSFILLMLYIRQKLLLPFKQLKDVPYELSKGNLTAPIPETKNRFFGKFTWGLDLLRENIEEQRSRELELQKEKKTLLLSLSHDIKTPLSAIKLYAKALEKGLYSDKEKQLEIAENINRKADEIEGYVSQIINASREDFLSISVETGEAYLSDIIDSISSYYKEKMDLNKTEFTIGEYQNCLLKCDLDRSVEVLQNLVENALKYGDGKEISINFSSEEDCILVSVTNTGSELPPEDIPHIFESFWRGANSHSVKGSGLGLYICRRIMNKMSGDIFAEIENDKMTVTAVFAKL